MPHVACTTISHTYVVWLLNVDLYTYITFDVMNMNYHSSVPTRM